MFSFTCFNGGLDRNNDFRQVEYYGSHYPGNPRIG